MTTRIRKRTYTRRSEKISYNNIKERIGLVINNSSEEPESLEGINNISTVSSIDNAGVEETKGFELGDNNSVRDNISISELKNLETNEDGFDMLEGFFMNLRNVYILNNLENERSFLSDYIYKLSDELSKLKEDNKVEYARRILEEIKILYNDYITNLNMDGEKMIIKDSSILKPDNDFINIKTTSDINIVNELINSNNIDIEEGNYVMFLEMIPSFDYLNNGTDSYNMMSLEEYNSNIYEDVLCIHKSIINNSKNNYYPFDFIIKHSPKIDEGIYNYIVSQFLYLYGVEKKQVYSNVEDYLEYIINLEDKKSMVLKRLKISDEEDLDIVINNVSINKIDENGEYKLIINNKVERRFPYFYIDSV